MLVLLDIGNTAATCGIYKNGRLLQFLTLLYNDIPKYVKNCQKSGINESIDIVISSVVPKITSKLEGALKGKNRRIWVVGKNLPVLLKHRYSRKNTLGIDRIVNMYGALKIYGGPALVVDFGTAVTFDYLSSKGIFEGGMIVPGPQLSFQCLIERAAQLPKKARLPEKAHSFLGTDTLGCLTSGILEGYGAMTDGLIERFKSKYGKNLKVIATGGFACHLKPYVSAVDIFDPQHSIKALLLLYKETKPIKIPS